MITLAEFKHKIIVWVLPFLLFQALPLNAFAFTRETNDNGTIYLYRKNRNVSFYLNENCYTGKDATLEGCKEAVNKSVSEWTGRSCTDLELGLSGETAATDVATDFMNLIVWRDSDDPKDPAHYWRHGPTVIAMTTTTYDPASGEIYDSDIEVNGLDYPFSDLDVCPSFDMDIRNTLTHEIGHCIGLGHSDIESAVMFESADRGDMGKRTLTDDDLEGLCTIYPKGKETPLSIGQSNLTGGCVTSTSGFGDIPAVALFVFLLWFLRIYFHRANLG